MSRIEFRPLDAAEEPAVVEVFDSEQNVQRGMLANEPLFFDVPEGAYLVQASWSDGARSRRVLDVGSDGVAVELEPPTGAPTPLLELGDPPQLPELDIGHAPGTDTAAAQPTFALWRRGNGGWEQRPLGDPIAVEAGIEFELQLDGALHLFEMNTRGVSQFASLPAERSIVAVRRVVTVTDADWRVDARTGERDVESLRGYVQRGELDVARLMAPEVMAERFLRSKMHAPRIAALGAYVLLRLGDLDRLHDWPDNLANWMEWLPDGPVIAAWQRLRSENPDYDRIRSLLVEAARRGLPVYSEGVRLLKDGLELFEADEERDWGVADALHEVNRYARALLWEKSETTFFGQGPDVPLMPRVM